MKTRVFIFLFFLSFINCTNNGNELSQDSFLEVKVDTLENGLVLIDSIITDKKSIKRIYDNDLGLMHRYYNEKNQVFIYEFFVEDSVTFRVSRIANGEEKVYGSNIVVIDNDIDSGFMKNWVYIALPIIIDRVDLAFIEVDSDGNETELLNEEIDNPKKLIKTKYDPAKSYYILSQVTLNSGRTHSYRYYFDNAR